MSTLYVDKTYHMQINTYIYQYRYYGELILGVKKLHCDRFQFKVLIQCINLTEIKGYLLINYLPKNIIK